MNSPLCEKKVRRTLLRKAKQVSPRIHEALKLVSAVPLKPPTADSVEEVLCQAVVGQQLSTRAADTIWNRLQDAKANRRLLDFILKSDPAVIRECGVSNSKGKALRAIADSFSTGELCEKSLFECDAAERANRLSAIWGIGKWTADMVNIFYYMEPDVWPEGDLAVRSTFNRLLRPGEEAQEMIAHFSPYRTYMALYMWRLKNEV